MGKLFQKALQCFQPLYYIIVERTIYIRELYSLRCCLPSLNLTPKHVSSISFSSRMAICGSLYDLSHWLFTILETKIYIVQLNGMFVMPAGRRKRKAAVPPDLLTTHN